MSEESEALGANVTWLLDHWTESFTGVLESMTEESPSMNWKPDSASDMGSGALIIEQTFVDCAEPMIWIALPEIVHQELGRRVLTAAGVEGSDAEENRATTLETIEQSIGGLLSALNQRISRTLKREPSNQAPAFPGGVQAFSVVIELGEITLEPLWIAFHPVLVSWMDGIPAVTSGERAPQQEMEIPAPPEPSRNFDMLLDVALPVSVSFGKTELAVKDVLKLTTGSIVELDRGVSEPVDIIVNNCIIARGEVVVVEGNYGVRVLSLVSRKERLRTGGAAVSESRSRMGAA